MSAAIGSAAGGDDEADPIPTTAPAAAEIPSEESSSLSPASRVLAMADKVADDEDGSIASSEDGSDDSIGPVSRPRRTINPGDLGEGGSRQRRRGFVQERRGKHKQSALRRPLGDSPLESPTESRASSNDSWRQALFGDRRLSPKSEVGEHDGRGSAGTGSASVAFSEESSMRGSPETAEQQQREACRDGEERVVENMDVKDLKAKAVELGIPTGGRKSQLKARIKQKLSVSSRLSDGGDAAATAFAASSGHDDPAAVAAAIIKTAAATTASSEGAAAYVTTPAKPASFPPGQGAGERIPSADGSRLGRPEAAPDAGVPAAADVFASPEPPAAESPREEEDSTSDEEYQDATGPSDGTPTPARSVTREFSPLAWPGAAGGEKSSGGEAMVAVEGTDPTEERDGSLASSLGPLLPQTPGGVSHDASTGVTAGSAEVADHDEGAGDSPATRGEVGAGAVDGCRDVEEGVARGVLGAGEGCPLLEGAGPAGGGAGGGESAVAEGREGATGLDVSEGGDPQGEGRKHEQQQQQQQQRTALCEGISCAAVRTVPGAAGSPPVTTSALPSSPAAASPPESDSEEQAAAPSTSVKAATEGGDGDGTDGDFMAKPEASSAPIMAVNSAVPAHTSVGEGASSSAVEVVSEALFPALESDDDGGGGGRSSPEDAREGVGEGGGSRGQRAHDGADGFGSAERAVAMDEEGEAGEGAGVRRVGEEEAARRDAGDERDSVRVVGGVEEEGAAAGAAWRREPDGGERERPHPSPSRQGGQADGTRSARRLPGGAVSASRGNELVPVALFPAAADGVEEEGEGQGEEVQRSRAEGRISWAPEDRAKQEKESGPLVVPSAEALTQKFLQVAILWEPILRNSGPSGGGGCWTGADASNSKAGRPLLPETEALKAKAKVLSTWFDLRARPVAMDIGTDVPEASTHDAEKVQRSAPPAGHNIRAGASEGVTTAVVREGHSVRADADRGESKSRASRRRSQERAACAAAPRSRSVVPIPTGAARASESGGATQRVPRTGKGRRGSLRRLSVSPPRTKFSGAATAARVSSGSRINRRSITPAHRGAGAKAASRGSVHAATASAAANAADTHPPVRKRNPLIRDKSPPRHSRTSILRPLAAAGRGSGGRGTADVLGAERRQVSAARRRRGVSVDRRTAAAGEGRPEGEPVGAMEAPSRTRELRFRKNSAAASHGANAAITPPAAFSLNDNNNDDPGFFFVEKARAGNNNGGESATASRGRDPHPCVGGDTPIGTVAPGSGSRSALQVFGFDPTVSKPPRDDMATRVKGTPEANATAA